MVTSSEILNACLWAEHHILSRYAETDDGQYGFFREWWSPAPLAIKIREINVIQPVGWSYIQWNEGVRPSWHPYTGCTWNDLRIDGNGFYTSYIERKEFTDTDWCVERPEVINTIEFLVQNETTQLIKNSSLEFRDPIQNKPYFWNAYGNITEWSSDAHSGSKSIRINTLEVENPEPTYWFTDVFPLKPSTYYYFEAYGKGKVESGEVKFRLEFLDGDMHILDVLWWYFPYGTYGDWLKFHDVMQSPSGTVFGRILFGVDGYGEKADFKADDFLVLECSEYEHIIPPSTITLTIQPLAYNTSRTVDVYLAGCLGVNRTTPKLLWSNAKNHLYEIYEETLPPFTGYGTIRYCARHSSLELCKQLLLDMALKSKSELQTLSNKVEALLSDYGFLKDGQPYDRYAPLYRASENFADDYMEDYETAHDVTLWQTAKSCGGDSLPPSGAPFGLGHYQYWSRVGVSRPLLWVGSFLYGDTASKGYMAVHLMNKYNDPTKTIEKELCWNNVSAENLLLYGYNLLRPYPHVEPPLKDGFDGKGFAYMDGFYSTTVLAVALIAFSELGYGFNYPEAENLADQMVDILIQTQWGYPYTTQFAPSFPTGYEGIFRNEELGQINRPDLAGAAVQGYLFDGSNLISVCRFDTLKQQATNQGITMPFEYGKYPTGENCVPKNRMEKGLSWLENTILFQRALHIYHWYKFQGGTGVFPAIIFKGVWWQPAISNEVQITVT